MIVKFADYSVVFLNYAGPAKSVFTTVTEHKIASYPATYCGSCMLQSYTNERIPMHHAADK